MAWRRTLKPVNYGHLVRRTRLAPHAAFFSTSTNPNFDGVVVGYYKSQKLTTTGNHVNEQSSGELLKHLSNFKSFKGEFGDQLLLSNVHPSIPRVLLVGLGEDPSSVPDPELDPDYDSSIKEEHSDLIRRVSASGFKKLKREGATSIGIESFGSDTKYFQAVSEGVGLSQFSYDSLKSKDANGTDDNVTVNVAPFEPDQSKNQKEIENYWESGKIIAEAQNFARKLASTPSNLMTPTIFAKEVETLFNEKFGKNNKSTAKVTVQVRDKDYLEKENMNLMLAVAQGSEEQPKLLEIHYELQNSGNNNKEEEVICLVGKGVTFDTGGISIKPSLDMGSMRADMTGAASVVSAVYGMASLNILQQIQNGGNGKNIKIIAVTPLVENMPSGTAIKPGDVVVSRAGKTVEIDNTDAEGRLILADALTYSQDKFNPSVLVDVATLTGAVDVALGGASIGVFSNSDNLWNEILKSGRESGERVWRLPLWKIYEKMVKSDYADLRNVGYGAGMGRGSAGSCTAAIFLKEFVKTKKWAHFDIAGLMKMKGEDVIPWGSKGTIEAPTVRLLINLVQNRVAQK